MLKLKRQEVHRVFDGWWKAQKLGHGEAYRWLAGQMKLPVHRTHIGQFDMVQCEQTIQAVYAAQTEKEAA